MVSIRTAVAALLAAGVAAWTVGPLFVQLTPGARAGTRARAGELQQAGFPVSSPEPVEPATEGKPFNGLILGLALGLLVGITGAGFPGAANAEDDVAPAEYDIRTGQSKKLGELWAKEKSKIWNVPKFSKPYDPKYKTPTTGAGRYHQFGIDFASPIGTIPAADDGKYPLVNKFVKAKDDPAIQAAVQAAKGTILKESKYGNFYSPSSPFKKDGLPVKSPYAYNPN
mmetsp:Transcript_14244/g.28729  ORF Transcript_14244/g.28729 Transcript_14244/m.28729 type:complete len:226 (-) Transcript_14244:159-836(-)